MEFIIFQVCNNVSKSVLNYNSGDKETESSAWIGTPTLFEKFLQESYPVNTNNLWVISAVVTTSTFLLFQLFFVKSKMIQFKMTVSFLSPLQPRSFLNIFTNIRSKNSY